MRLQFPRAVLGEAAFSGVQATALGDANAQIELGEMVALAGMYAVRFVDDAALPEGRDWVLAMDDGDTFFIVKRSRVTEQVLEEGWAAYRLHCQVPTVPQPRKPALVQIA